MLAIIYGLVTPADNKVRYVGKTIDLPRRMRRHFSDRSNTHRCHGIQKSVREGRPVFPIVLEVVPLSEWEEAERRWIRHFGIENLWNGTHGGDGVSMTAELRRRHSLIMGRIYADPAQRKRLSEMARDPRRVVARREGVRRWISQPENRNRRAEQSRRQAKDPNWQQAVAASNRAKASDPAWIASVQPSLKKLHSDPLIAARQREQCRAAMSRPEWIEATRKGTALRTADPKWRANVAAGRRASAKLSFDLAKQIRDRYSAGGVTQEELAAEYGVTRTNIGYIVRGKAWV